MKRNRQRRFRLEHEDWYGPTWKTTRRLKARPRWRGILSPALGRSYLEAAERAWARAVQS